MSVTPFIERANRLSNIRKQLANESPYWPDYILRDIDHEIYASTILRVKHENGTWYAVHHLEVASARPSMFPRITGSDLLHRLISNVYRSIVFKLKVDLTLTTSMGEPLFKVDKLQIEEDERLQQQNESSG